MDLSGQLGLVQVLLSFLGGRWGGGTRQGESDMSLVCVWVAWGGVFCYASLLYLSSVLLSNSGDLTLVLFVSFFVFVLGFFSFL